MIRVLLVDDQALVRGGFRSILEGQDDIEATRRLLSQVRFPGRVLMLTTFDHDEYVYEALRAGASGFLLKSAPPRELAAAVRTVAAGDALLAPQITRRMIEEYVRRPPPGSRTPAVLAALAPRELAVLQHIALGQSNVEIAAELFLSVPTVKTYVTRILAKLQLRDRVHAVVLAYECGLVQPGTQQK